MIQEGVLLEKYGTINKNLFHVIILETECNCNDFLHDVYDYCEKCGKMYFETCDWPHAENVKNPAGMHNCISMNLKDRGIPKIPQA